MIWDDIIVVGGKVDIVVCDFGDVVFVVKFIFYVIKEFGWIFDIVVNCGGI